MAKVYNRDIELAGTSRITKNGATIIDENGNVDAPLTTTNLTTSGNTTLGDSSADAVTLNGTTTALAPVTVGVNDTGHDVKFFGATSGKSWLWDESADKMIVTGDAQVTGVLSTANTDIGVGGAAVVTLQSNVTLAANKGIAGSVAGSYAPVVFAAVQETIAAGAGGAISVTKHMTDISTDAGGDAFTLASGTELGQLKYILLTVDGGGDAVITGNFAGTSNTLTMADAGDYARLMWNGSEWVEIELGNTIDGITKPVMSTV